MSKNFEEDDDKTVFMPLDEYTRSTVGQNSDENSQKHSTSNINELTQESVFKKISGLEYMAGPNNLIKYASELFAIHYQLIHNTLDCSADRLRVILADALTKFTVRCQQNGVSERALKSSQYVLCTFLDETILSTNFGQDIKWSQQSMLSSNFNESWGGETFYKIRLFCLDNLAEFIEVFELVYVGVCLGFKGQYANASNGELMLERLKRESYDAICQYRNLTEGEPLSPSWATEYQPKVIPSQKYSFGIFFLITFCILVVIYAGLSFFLHSQEVPVLNDVNQAKHMLMMKIDKEKKSPQISEN